MGYYSGKAPSVSGDAIFCKARKAGATIEEAKEAAAVWLKSQKEQDEMIRQNLEQMHLEKLKADIQPSFLHKLLHSPRQSFLDWLNKHRI